MPSESIHHHPGNLIDLNKTEIAESSIFSVPSASSFPRLPRSLFCFTQNLIGLQFTQKSR